MEMDWIMEKTASGDHHSSPAELIIIFKGKRFPVQKSLLIEKCEYFKTMLTNLREGDSNEVIFQHESLNVDTLQVILNYIHTDEVEFSTSNVDDLSTAAHFFMLHNLTQSSFDFKVKHFEQILKSRSFLNWQLSSVQEVLLSDRVVVSNEKKMLMFAISWINHDFDERRKNIAALLQNVRFSRVTKEERFEVAHKLVMGIPRELATRPSPIREYHRGIYLYDERQGAEVTFQRYCPIDGSVTNLQPPSVDGIHWLFMVNDEKIYYMGRSSYSHVYDPLEDEWTTETIADGQVVEFWMNRRGSITYCSFEGIIYAFAKAEQKIKVFCLKSNAWVVASHPWSISTSTGFNLRYKQVQTATACGDSIYIVLSGATDILRYKPSTRVWTEISCPYNVEQKYKIVANKSKLLFHFHDSRLVCSYDVVTKSFKEYYCPPEVTCPSHIALYNDSIYFLPWHCSSFDEQLGLHAYQVQQLDATFLDEEISLGHVGSSPPVLKTQLSCIHHVATIQ